MASQVVPSSNLLQGLHALHVMLLMLSPDRCSYAVLMLHSISSSISTELGCIPGLEPPVTTALDAAWISSLA